MGEDNARSPWEDVLRVYGRDNGSGYFQTLNGISDRLVIDFPRSRECNVQLRLMPLRSIAC